MEINSQLKLDPSTWLQKSLRLSYFHGFGNITDHLLPRKKQGDISVNLFIFVLDAETHLIDIH